MRFNMPRLVIELFQYSWYRGRRGVVIEDIPDTRAIGFNDNISSVRIYKGPGYAPGASQKALFFEDRDFKGRRLALGPGYYQSLHQFSYNFGNVISSIAMRSESRADGPVWGGAPAVIELYSELNFGGRKTVVVRDEPQMTARFTNEVRSMRVLKGPDCPDVGCRIQLFPNADFDGVPVSVKLTQRDSVYEIPDMRALPQSSIQSVGSMKIEGWTSSTEFTDVVFQDEFDGTRLHENWEWIDPREDGEWKERQGWLILRAQAGQDLRRGENFDAPRLIQPIAGDFSIETRIQVTRDSRPHGGILVWYDEDNFLTLERTADDHDFKGDVRFEQHSFRGAGLIGRSQGLRGSNLLYLRLERSGNEFLASASSNGVDWISCGSRFMSMPETVFVGLHALCPGNMSPTSTRFDFFKVFARPEDRTIENPRIPTSRDSRRMRRRFTALRRLS